MSTMDLDLIISVLTVIQIIFIILGMVLRSMIIYFEQFGRDPQKRSLLNRVSWYFYVLKDHVLVTSFEYHFSRLQPFLSFQ